MTPFNTTTSRESEEKLPSVVVATPNNQAIIITKTPEGIPFINESNKISIKDTQGETTLELDKNSHVCQYNNQKIAVQHNNAIYTSDALSQGFSKVPGLDGTEKIKFNERVFRKYGEVVASQGNGDTIKCLLNGKTYILPSNYNGLRVDFWENDYDIHMKNNNQFYAKWGSMDKYRIYNIENEKITLQKEFLLSKEEEPYFLANGKVATFTEKNKKQTVKVDGETRKNQINNVSWSFHHDANHIWIKNENELIVDDKKIDLPDKEYANIDKIAFSSDGKTLLVAAKYNQAYYETKIQHKGNYLFCYQDGILVKELTLPNDVGIWGIAVYSADENGVSNYAYHTSKNQIYLNGHLANLERKDIETFDFQDGKLHIRGKDADDDLHDELLSLDEDTEAAEKATQTAEKQNNAALLEMLKKLWLTSPESLQQLVDWAKKSSALLEDFQQKFQRLTLENMDNKDELKKSQQENHQLKITNGNLQGDLDDIKKGIHKGTLGYKIDDNAKRVLGL